MTLNGQCGLHVVNTTCESNASVPAIGMPDENVFDITVELYLIGFIGLVGLLGNIAFLVILHQDKEHREHLFLLQLLAISDSLYLVTSLLRYPLKYLVKNPHLYHQMQFYIYPLLKTFQAITIWMMVLVTIDRYIYVCKPLRAIKMFGARPRRICAAVVAAFGIIFSLPRFFDSCIMAFESCGQVIVSRVVPKEVFANFYYLNIYRYGMFIVFLYIIPLTLLFTLNLSLIQAIKKSKRRQSEMEIPLRNSSSKTRHHGHHHHSDNNATVVLVIIILVFIICETPESILLILTTLQQNKVMTFISRPFYICNTISALLMVVNSSVNFFIYFALGKRFRYILRKWISRSSRTLHH